MQRGDVVLGQPHHRGDRPAAEPKLAQHRHGHVPHPGVPGRVAGQQRRSGADECHAVMLGAAQVPGVGHALQDGRSGWRHAIILSQF